MARWRITLEYDGSAFRGWQLQPDEPTVQGAVEDALAQLFGAPIRVHGAGRTDTGVHAREQVARFDTDVERAADAVRDGLNAKLPPQVACLDAAVVASDFDPRRWPHTKRYVYRWLDRRPPSALRRGRVWHVREGLDVPAMDTAAAHLVGCHDFSSFRATGCGAAHATRTVHRATVGRVRDEVHLAVQGTGFLRHMIRIIAGTLCDVGRGARPPAWVADVLAARDREAAGRTAPAHGLTLQSIVYD